MNVTEQLNQPYRRNDALTCSAVMRHIDLHYADVFGEVHRRACVQVARDANDATVGCDMADQIAEKLGVIRERFAAERNLRASL